MIRSRRYLWSLVLLFWVLPAAAEGQYAEQVQRYLDEIEARAAAEGFAMEGESSGWMVNGVQGGTIVRLPAGSYRIVGACDDDCSDIDLMVSRMDNQETLDTDEELDSFPVVEFAIEQEADILIGISMPGCDTARCYAGYRWYRSTGGAQAAEPEAAGAGGWEQQVAMQFDAIGAPDNAELVDDRMGLVGTGEETRFSVNLGPGSYGGVAVCDYDCSNVDLAVYDAGGSLVSSDELDDDVPIVDFEIGKGGGTYYFVVRMVSCSANGCGYGFRLFRQN